MEKALVRLENIELLNFKNVKSGSISMPKGEEQAQILGIYGQNGSGKTAVIDALFFLKTMMTGERLPKDVVNYIYFGETEASLSFDFKIMKEDEDENTVNVSYNFKIILDEDRTIERICEELSFSGIWHGVKAAKSTLVMKDEENVILPQHRRKQIAINEKGKDIKEGSLLRLILTTMLAEKERRSFMFGADFDEFWKKGSETDEIWFLIPVLKNYALSSLFVVRNKDTGIINLDFGLPFAFKHEKNNKLTVGNMFVDYLEPTIFDQDKFDVFSSVIKNLNVVLRSIIPDLTVEIKTHGSQMTQDGAEGMRFELMSVKKDIKIPLQYESDGIKKIISILNLLITMYSNPSVCVAIDELDAGIYEYLLGEMLSVISESAAGQLIFTSHNLRPLELIDKSSIVFTTTNPKNRYIRFTNVKRNNNLRDLYIRNIALGGLEETLYESTKSHEIRRAFRKAGRALNE